SIKVTEDALDKRTELVNIALKEDVSGKHVRENEQELLNIQLERIKLNISKIKLEENSLKLLNIEIKKADTLKKAYQDALKSVSIGVDITEQASKYETAWLGALDAVSKKLFKNEQERQTYIANSIIGVSEAPVLASIGPKPKVTDLSSQLEKQKERAELFVIEAEFLEKTNNLLDQQADREAILALLAAEKLLDQLELQEEQAYLATEEATAAAAITLQKEIIKGIEEERVNLLEKIVSQKIIEAELVNQTMQDELNLGVRATAIAQKQLVIETKLNKLRKSGKFEGADLEKNL
ncbi:unnamed protein product, partial [marine sediment metagenome]